MPKILRRLALWLAATVLPVVLVVSIRCVYAFRDRTPGYSLALDIDGGRNLTALKPLASRFLGFGRARMRPEPEAMRRDRVYPRVSVTGLESDPR